MTGLQRNILGLFALFEQDNFKKGYYNSHWLTCGFVLSQEYLCNKLGTELAHLEI